ncbi:ATP-dependent Clp protease proteolytic subunit [Pigmentiphaga litoralis]|uniref:head maturation protease, ClpP-related n=1 Tax=Pigmentiphaga litoralis TaxID=516702 RepID=UPI00167499A5|nr:head maturation protease, ClpP-related [Pigmentiphaga litoralis]GGX32753.1 ATP-dependent Clp protease proteolytic subunit [Pigmentiphaga litoralis]
MSLLKLPEIRADQRVGAAQFDVRPEALERWEPGVRAAADSDASISVYDSIGENWDGTGVTAKRIGAALRNIGQRDVTVNINSPGGDFFEGVAIYNLLREHQARVTVRVMGVAASAASIIAMAGDDILMGDGAFLMIHNAWAVAIGNRHDLRESADWLEPFDEAMADVYAARTGLDAKAIAKLMDDESWIGASVAVKDGFATGLIERAAIAHDSGTQAQGSRKALAMVEASMARAGHSRSARRDTLKALFSGTPSAADQPAMPSAGDLAASLQSLITSLKA